VTITIEKTLFAKRKTLQLQYCKNLHKRRHVLGVQADFVFSIGCFLQNQPENVLKVFSKFFLKLNTAQTTNR